VALLPSSVLWATALVRPVPLLFAPVLFCHEILENGPEDAHGLLVFLAFHVDFEEKPPYDFPGGFISFLPDRVSLALSDSLWDLRLASHRLLRVRVLVFGWLQDLLARSFLLALRASRPSGRLPRLIICFYFLEVQNLRQCATNRLPLKVLSTAFSALRMRVGLPALLTAGRPSAPIGPARSLRAAAAFGVTIMSVGPA
jgi:hypothetical protein